MGNAYSYDLRIRVVEAIDEGQAITKVSKDLRVGRTTIYNWLKQRDEKGRLRPNENWQKGHSHKITDLEKFKIFVEKNKEKTLVELAKAWGGVQRMTIQRALKKLGFTRKKNQLWIQGAPRKRKTRLSSPIKDH